jgi:cbb3-type cytochrome oxidase subunit 3
MSSPGSNKIPPVGNDVSGSFVSGLKQTGYLVFNKETLTAITWIIVVGIIVYLATGSFTRSDMPEGSGMLLFSRSFDIVVFGLVLLLIVYSYYSSNQKDRENVLQWVFNWTRDFFNQPGYSAIETGIFALVFYAIIYLFRIPRSPEFAPVTVYILESKIWIVFLTLGIVAFFKYVLKIPIIDILMGDQWSNFWNGLPENAPKIFSGVSGAPGSSTPGSSSPSNSPGSSSQSSSPGSKSQSSTSPGMEVFNIANNIYTYSDASAVCAAYGATLANYDQVESAYNGGAEWCNYGWSDNQMAFFPTQKDTWQKYNATGDQKNDCGRPGVNGGYFDNPNIKFGVNCYGMKPPPSALEKAALGNRKDPVIPKSPGDRAFQDKIDAISKQKDQLNLNSFNNKKWSEMRG